MESVLRDGPLVDVSLLPDGLDMRVTGEADRGGLSGKMRQQGAQGQKVIELVTRV